MELYAKRLDDLMCDIEFKPLRSREATGLPFLTFLERTTLCSWVTRLSGCFFFLGMLLDFPVLLLPAEQSMVKVSLEKLSVSESPDSPASELL